MGNRNKKNRKVFRVLALGILFWILCMGSAGATVKAGEQACVIDAEVLPSDKYAYEIQLTVEKIGRASWRERVFRAV